MRFKDLILEGTKGAKWGKFHSAKCVSDLSLPENDWRISTLNISREKLTSLEGCPPNVGAMICENNLLTSFKGAPSYVNGQVDARDNKFINLRNVHFDLPIVEGPLRMGKNRIKSHVLGVILIEGLTDFTYEDTSVNIWANILNQHLGGLSKQIRQSRMYDCQQALIEAGFDEHAKL